MSETQTQGRHHARRLSESTYLCSCGARFSAFDLPHYSLAADGDKLYAKNRNRAKSHARMANRHEERA